MKHCPFGEVFWFWESFFSNFLLGKWVDHHLHYLHLTTNLKFFLGENSQYVIQGQFCSAFFYGKKNQIMKKKFILLSSWKMVNKFVWRGGFVGFSEFLDSGEATSLVLIWGLKRDLETWFLLFAVYTVTPPSFYPLL
jgi:hypothetical protein